MLPRTRDGQPIQLGPIVTGLILLAVAGGISGNAMLGLAWAQAENNKEKIEKVDDTVRKARESAARTETKVEELAKQVERLRRQNDIILQEVRRRNGG